MPSSTVTSKGQVTIPREVRERLGIEKGDRLVFNISRSGSIALTAEKPRPLTSILGMLSTYRKRSPVSVEAMNAAILRRARERYRRGRKR